MVTNGSVALPVALAALMLSSCVPASLSGAASPTTVDARATALASAPDPTRPIPTVFASRPTQTQFPASRTPEPSPTTPMAYECDAMVDPGWLAFVTRPDHERSEIALIDVANGTTKLLGGAASISNPLVSPNGAYIAFVKNNHSLVVMSISDGRESAILSGVSTGAVFDWLADSRTLIVRLNDGRIALALADGSTSQPKNVDQLDTLFVTSLAASRIDSRIVLAGAQDARLIDLATFVFQADSGILTPIHPVGTRETLPGWVHPQGESVFLLQDNTLTLHNLHTAERKLVYLPTGYIVWYSASPDGKLLAVLEREQTFSANGTLELVSDRLLLLDSSGNVVSVVASLASQDGTTHITPGQWSRRQPQISYVESAKTASRLIVFDTCSNTAKVVGDFVTDDRSDWLP